MPLTSIHSSPDADFTKMVLDLVEQIPAGKVVTYGDVAWAIGSNAPRAVGRVMALYGHSTHWWRVVPVSGKAPQGHESLALPHYIAEGTPLKRDLAQFEYRIKMSSARLGFDHKIYEDAVSPRKLQQQAEFEINNSGGF